MLRFFEVLLDHPNSGAGLIPGRTGQFPVERDLYTVLGNLVKPGKTTERPHTTGVGQEWLGPSYFFISLVLGPLNSLLGYVPS